MARLLFEKTGRAVWISHLDLMRLFQRAFKRAGLSLKHTQGFNPRPSVSIALPLSVGVESNCELLDFDLEGCDISLNDLTDKLNASLIEGVNVRQAYIHGKKLRELSLLSCTIRLYYDPGLPLNIVNRIYSIFQRDRLLVTKKSKNGLVEQDIIPMIYELKVTTGKENEVMIDALIACQNPSLNPMQLVQAIEKYLPDCIPDRVICRRNEIYDSNKNVFR